MGELGVRKQRGVETLCPRYMLTGNNRWQQRVTNPSDRTGPLVQATEGG